MRRRERSALGWRTGSAVALAAVVIIIPVVACITLPSLDLPGRICWAVKRGTTGSHTSLIPNDDATTGLLATVFLVCNFSLAVLIGLVLDARSKLRERKPTHLARRLAMLFALLAFYGILGYSASNECAVVGRGGFATQSLTSQVEIHRWPDLEEIRRLHSFDRVTNVDGSQKMGASRHFYYKLVFRDGSLWQSADSRNWSWGITDRAIKRASSYSSVPITDYRAQGDTP